MEPKSTKVCTKCGVEKISTEFRKRTAVKDGLQSWCKSCCKVHEKQHWDTNETRRETSKRRSVVSRQKMRECIYEYLVVHPCEDCGEDDPIVLEFDHIDPSQKSFTIGNAGKQIFSLVTLQEEISKCRVVCANCHRRRTARQFNWGKVNMVGMLRIELS